MGMILHCALPWGTFFGNVVVHVGAIHVPYALLLFILQMKHDICNVLYCV